MEARERQLLMLCDWRAAIRLGQMPQRINLNYPGRKRCSTALIRSLRSFLAAVG